MSHGSIVSHAALAAALLAAWLLVESIRNNQLTLELVARQAHTDNLRAEADSLRDRVQTMNARLDAADRLANSVGPSILRDLVALSADNRNPAIAALLQKHGIADPSDPPPAPGIPQSGFPER